MSAPVALTITLLLLAGNAFFVGAEFAWVIHIDPDLRRGLGG